jgi:hypothetical protein
MSSTTDRFNIRKVAVELSISADQVTSTIQLLDEGATIPFISRYRKEMTGSLDEVQIANVRDLMQQYRALEQRREFILHTIQEQGKLTDELRSRIEGAENINQLEDLYLPNGEYRYTNGWNWIGVVATLAGCALAWGGLVIPFLKPLYNYAWFVGFIVSGGVYYLLSPRRTAAVEPQLTTS